ncbi:hypothetical protein EN935_37650, partial [Mesorhizobium sp. M7D.F.Ca.US.004.03.1.1]
MAWHNINLCAAGFSMLTTNSDLLSWSEKAIGNVVIRNRYVLTGHGTGMVLGGQAGNQLIDYYAERAKGGVGLIMLGTQQVHSSSPGLGHLLTNYNDSIIPSLRAIAGAVHAHGGKLFGYIGHFGAQANSFPRPPWSASAFYDEERGTFCRSMTIADMEEIATAHADAALRNIESGMDGIEVHCGHGLLLHQFLSPWTNKREDDYGGDTIRRLRFPQEVLRAVRRRIGPGIPLGVRISGIETVVGGLELDEMRIVAAGLVEAGALDYLDVSIGNDRDPVSRMLHH